VEALEGVRGHETVARLLAGTDAFLFDCDGVLWQGDTPLPGAAAAVMHLRAQGKRVFFVTNNSTQSRAALLSKFRRIGIAAQAEEVLSSAYAAALLLQRCLPPGRQAYVVGEQGICDELRLAGVPFCGGPSDCGLEVMQQQHCGIAIAGADDKRSAEAEAEADAQAQPVQQVQVQVQVQVEVSRVENVGAVVVGLDRRLNYWKLQRAQLCLQDPAVVFVATNYDATAHLTSGTLWAGAGAVVAAVAAASGRTPTVAGKPSATLLESLLLRHPELHRDRMVMVGDRLDTDIAFGANNGLQTLLTLSGVTSREQLQAAASGATASSLCPDYVCESIASLLPTAAEAAEAAEE